VAVVALATYTLIGAPLDGQANDPHAWAAATTGLFGAGLAALLLTRSPRHPIGWLFLVIGITRRSPGLLRCGLSRRLSPIRAAQAVTSHLGSRPGHRRLGRRWPR
jgi:hypothetical protein